jgi:plasmid stability protein
MPSLQVKNVPEETLAVLRRRAAQSHQSLQEYMLERLIAEAQQPTWNEIWADLDRTRGADLSYAQILATINTGRDEH